MKCSRIKNLLSDYIDNILPENTKKEIDEHIKNCENCKHELELLQQSVTLCRQTETVPLPNYFEENLMDCIDSVAERRWIFRINRPWIYSSAAAAVICIVFMWNFIYSTYMETKSSYNPPLTQNGSVSNRYSDDSELASGAANDENAENSEIPQETEDTANLQSPVVSETPSAGNTDLTQTPENTAPPANQQSLFGSAASVTAVPSPSPSSKIQAAPSPSNTAKIASDITENASDSSVNERASGSIGGNGGGGSSSGAISSYMMPAAPANASFNTSKSTFVAASNASDAISWINSNLQPLSTSSSRGYTIITLNENDFYKLKASASEFGATTADISENAPYASIIDHSGGYSAVIYNP